VGVHVFLLTFGIALPFNKRNIMAYDIDYADIKGGQRWKLSSTASSPLSAAATFPIDRDCSRD
jgi:hypothetical protein